MDNEEDLVEGSGEPPRAQQRCVVHYTCWTWRDGVIGEKYESSHDDGRPLEFCNGRGPSAPWARSISSMKPGGKRRVLLPPFLFEIELLHVLNPEPIWQDLALLPSPLADLLKAMCLDSQDVFREGGMAPRVVAFDDAITAQPTRATASNERLCAWFRCCVQGDTTCSVLVAAQPLVDELLAAIAQAYPGGAVHVEIDEEPGGWLSSLQLWVATAEHRAYVVLDWSVS